MRRFIPTVLALATLVLGSTFAASAAEKSGPAPYNLVLEASLPEATSLALAFDDKEARPIELTVVDGKLRKGVSIPGAQGGRRIELRAENSEGKVVYEGAFELDIGTNFTPQVSVELKSALDGSLGEVSLASHRVAVEFAAVERDGKPFTRMTADVFDAMGSRLELKDGELEWDVDDPWFRKHALACPESRGHSVCVQFEPRKPDGYEISLDACFHGRICVTEPVPPVVPVWRMVSVGLGAHACALRLDGHAFCWGKGEQGQLGFDAPKYCSPSGESGGSTGCGLLPQEVECIWGPCRFIDISAGVDHTCAIDVDRHAWCWGNNYTGALGLGVFSEPESSGIAVPHRVVDPAEELDREFLAIRAGAGATCALTTTQHVYCWGFNGTNLVPDSTRRWLETPQVVNLSEPVDALDLTNLHACAKTASGSLYCWGGTANGELGPRTVTNTAPCIWCPAAPLLMQGLTIPSATNVILVSAGETGTCAHLGNGETTCWGLAIHDFPGTLPLKRLSRGAHHYCAISASNALPDQLQCAGTKALGDGVALHPFPGVGPIPVLNPITRFKDVDTGMDFTCAIGVDEEIYCWGAGSFGSLGLGSPDYGVDVPTALRFPTAPLTPQFPASNTRKP